MRALILSILIILSIPDCLAYEVAKIAKKVQNIPTTYLQEQDVAKFFDDYMKSYNDYLSDTSNTAPLTTMAENYHVPSFQMISLAVNKSLKQLKPLSSTENYAIGIKAYLDQLITKGVGSIEWEKVDIQMLTENTAYVSNIGVRYKKDGKVFNKVAADYLIFKTEGAWKIAGLVVHKPEPYNNLETKNEVNMVLEVFLKNYNDILSYDETISENGPLFSETGKNMNIPAITILQDGKFVFFESQQQIIEDRKSFIFYLKSHDAAQLNFDTVQIKMTSETTAIASNIVAFNTSGGKTVFKIGATYMFNKTPEGWKIALITFHTPETILNFNQSLINTEKKS